MSNKLLNILKKYIPEPSSGKYEHLSSATTNLQQATLNSIIFYNLQNLEKAYDIFLNRLENSEYGLLVLTGKVPEKLPANSVFMAKEKIEKFKKEICDVIYPFPDKFNLVAVTGTNGKTSTVHFAKEICRVNGVLAASLGTMGAFVGDEKLEDIGLTTPSFVDFRRLISTLSQRQCHILFFELSSHALDQERIGQLNFPVAGWTNFTQDHLDYHKTMDEYFAAKKLIINYLEPGATLFVSEQYLLSKISSPHVKKSYTIEGVELPSFLLMDFARKNFELAYSLVKNILPELNLERINEISAPDGRATLYEFGDKKFIIDYAHTPDALKNILENLKESFPEREIVCVFGCGGDRDRTKRPLMANVAEEYSDFQLVTSDNPRFEDPVQIVKDIEKGFVKEKHKTILDRSEAIKFAVEKSNGNNIVLIAGKGSEPYIDIKGVKHSFSDEQEMKKYVRENGL